jgi:hypothetical protein
MIDEFVAITGISDRSQAQNWLEAAGFNLNTAVEMYMSMGSTSGGSVAVPPTVSMPMNYDPYGTSVSEISRAISSSSGSEYPGDDDDYVDDFDNEIRGHALPVVDEDGIRRADEVKRQRLLAGGMRQRQAAMMNRTSTIFAEKKNASSHDKKLAEMFSRPIQMMFQGTFMEARDFAKKQNKWLMVNIQNESEFACHELNRDVWKEDSISMYVQMGFVFWQQLHDKPEGSKFCDIYKVNIQPHISFIDPRTGLNKWRHDGPVNITNFAEKLQDYLSSEPSPLESSNILTIRSTSSSGLSTVGVIQGSGSGRGEQLKRKASGMSTTTEDDDLERAIVESLRDANGSKSRNMNDKIIELDGASSNIDSVGSVTATTVDLTDTTQDTTTTTQDTTTTTQNTTTIAATLTGGNGETKTNSETMTNGNKNKNLVQDFGPVGDEPSEGSRIQIKFPTDTNIKPYKRKYLPTDKIKLLYAVALEQIRNCNFKDDSNLGCFDLFLTFPRTNLSEHMEDTIADIGLAGSQIFVTWK